MASEKIPGNPMAIDLETSSEGRQGVGREYAGP